MKNGKTHSLKSLRIMLENTGKHFSGNYQEWQSIVRSVGKARQALKDKREGQGLLKLEANDFLAYCLNALKTKQGTKRITHLLTLKDI